MGISLPAVQSMQAALNRRDYRAICDTSSTSCRLHKTNIPKVQRTAEVLFLTPHIKGCGEIRGRGLVDQLGITCQLLGLHMSISIAYGLSHVQSRT